MEELLHKGISGLPFGGGGGLDVDGALALLVLMVGVCLADLKGFSADCGLAGG